MYNQTNQQLETSRCFEARPRVNYRRVFLKLANKLRRQRDRYSMFVDELRVSATDPDKSDTETDILLERAEQVTRSVEDLTYILERAKEFCSEEDRKLIDNGTY